MSSEIDHIIWACADLEQGSRQFETLTGVRPRFGGVHADGATQNALVALGPECYLEILAPVGPPTVDDGAWVRTLHTAVEPRVLTYCLRSGSSLRDLAGIAAGLGWHNAIVANNGRTTPAGVALRWQWLAPTAESFGWAFPFFIDWLDSVHPARSLSAETPDRTIQLQRFAVGHPDAIGLAQTLGSFGATVPTYTAKEGGFRLDLLTPRGIVSL
jgi:Glyoxalase-like domain